MCKAKWYKAQGAGHKAREQIGEENRSKTGEYLMINPRTAESVEIRCYQRIRACFFPEP